MKRRVKSGESQFRIDLKKNDFRRLAKTLCGAAVIFGGSALLPQSETKAQSLDQAIQTAISQQDFQNCNAFDFTFVGGTPVSSEAGPTLQFLCATPNTANQASAGGGAALSSSATASPVIERRLRRLEEDDEKQTSSLQGASPDTVMKLTNKLSVFASFEYELLDKDRTSNEDGFDSDNFSVTGGADYRINNSTLVGTAFSYVRQDGDFDGGGNFTNDSYGGLVFANFIPAPGFFLDAVLGGSYKDYKNGRPVLFTENNEGVPTAIRSVSGNASSDTSGYSIEGAVKGGYDFIFGRYTVGPRVGLDIVHTEIDGYTESGDSGLELRIDDQDVTSVQSTLGVLATAAVSTKLGVIVPQVGLDYIHEFDNDQRNINFSFVQDLRATPATFTYQNQAPDRDFLNLHGGVSMVLPHGWTTFFNYRGLFAHSFFDSHAFGGGLRKEF